MDRVVVGTTRTLTPLSKKNSEGKGPPVLLLLITLGFEHLFDRNM